MASTTYLNARLGAFSFAWCRGGDYTQREEERVEAGSLFLQGDVATTTNQLNRLCPH